MANNDMTEAHPNAMPAGTRVFEFEVERVIGEGGFSIVYLAFDHSLHRRVALKEYLPSAFAYRKNAHTVLPRSAKSRETFDAGMRSFLQEARLLAQFDHPALVKVFRFWEAHGSAYMAMVHYQGDTLRALLKENPGFATESNIKALAAPLLDAVQQLHEHHCYHRDIAPDNVIVQPSGLPVLLDFGAARRIIGDMTQALTAVLKPGYAPVEQYADEGGLTQGPWTDVYAFAAMLYSAVAGKPPPASVARVLRDEMVPLSRNPPAGYDMQFLRGIDAGLAVRPEGRPQSIREFREALGMTQFVEQQRPTTVRMGPAASTAGPVTSTPGPATSDPGSATFQTRPFTSNAVPPTVPVTAKTKPVTTSKVTPVVPAVPHVEPADNELTRPVTRSKLDRLLKAPPVATPLASSDATEDSERTIVAGRPPRVVPVKPVRSDAEEAPRRHSFGKRRIALVAGLILAVSVAVIAVNTLIDSPRDTAADRPTAERRTTAVVPPAPGNDKLATSNATPKAGTERTPTPSPAVEARESGSTLTARTPASTQATVAKAEIPPSPKALPPAPAAAAKNLPPASLPSPAPPRPSETMAARTTVTDAGKAATPPAKNAVIEAPKAPPMVAAAPLAPESPKPAPAAPVSGPVPTPTVTARSEVPAPTTAAKSAVPAEPPESRIVASLNLKPGPLDAKAQYEKGKDYELGRNTAKDYVEAANWYRRAADQGFAAAQVELGKLYGNGWGVAKSDAEAVRWFRAAAQTGHAGGQNALGFMYANGRAVDRDYAEALKWYRKAAEQGDAAAENNLGWMYENGFGVAANNAESTRWYEMAAAKGYALALNNLGRTYFLGRGVLRNDVLAASWYRKAAELNNASAQDNLGFMYESGRGVMRDTAEALRLYRKAAEQENTSAQFHLGRMYESGVGVPKDEVEAAKWYRKAAAKGHAEASTRLAALGGAGAK
ncbi:MAG: protein kinase [Betaproteobacteria bacterium]